MHVNNLMIYQQKIHLILPFQETWFVSNGGRSIKTNNHLRFRDGEGPQNQLYAYDFRSKTTGREKTLDDFPVFGKEVLAPANGVVIQTIDGAFDMQPGERNRSVGVGNTVVINHENSEYSLLCHLKHNSISVKVGDKVKQGEIIALCGNSGNSFQPHIHYHLQNGPYMHNSKALPAHFAHILVDGKEKFNYEPIRGQMVSNIDTLDVS